jgi:hypothetical protein
MILAEVSTKVQTSPYGDNSVTVSGTTCTQSYRTPNQLHHKTHKHSAPAISAAHAKGMSVTSVRAALFCAEERRIAAKLTVSRSEVSCGDVKE